MNPLQAAFVKSLSLHKFQLHLKFCMMIDDCMFYPFIFLLEY